MKRKLNKSLRLSLICISLVLLVAGAFLLERQIADPGTLEKKVPVYSYRNKGAVEYKVLLKENSIYPQKVIGENEIYLTKLVDQLKSTFKYEFTGEKAIDIKGDYEIVGILEAYNAEDEGTRTVWKKRFTFVPKTEFQARDKKLSITRNVSLNIEALNKFLTSVSEANEITLPAKFTVFMNVHLKSITDGGRIKETISPSITMPLNESYFEIVKKEIDLPGAIEQTETVPQPLNKIQFALCAAVLLLAGASLFYLLMYTCSKENDQFTRQLNRIFKKHGNRLVALNNDIAMTSERAYKVKSIEDLVRVADEIGKPIMYRFSRDHYKISQFYVIDDTCSYIFNLEDALGKFEGQALPEGTKQSIVWDKL